jgi:predicted nucleic acid-binding protein
MIVLDTNVLSELFRSKPAPQVVAWLDGQDSSELVTTAITAAELRAGVAQLPNGSRKTRIGDRVEQLLTQTFAGYILAFDVHSSAYYAQVLAARKRSGSPISGLDAQIAALCRQHEATLASRNVKDFAATGIDVVDPWLAPS